MESTPLYRQVAGHYRRAIESGTLTAGDRMPSVRALMGLHGVSLSTALQACRQLESDGLLEARPRAGYFVSAPQRAPLAPLTEPDAALPDPAQRAEGKTGPMGKFSIAAGARIISNVRIE